LVIRNSTHDFFPAGAMVRSVTAASLRRQGNICPVYALLALTLRWWFQPVLLGF
jgi:hypothetical protein